MTRIRGTYRLRDISGNRWTLSGPYNLTDTLSAAIMMDANANMAAATTFDTCTLERCQTLNHYALHLDRLTIYLGVKEGQKMQEFLQKAEAVA